MSRIEMISNPWLAKDRMAESRPGPMPETRTSTLWGPVLDTFSAIAAVTLEAAKGVAFLGPEKPNAPEVAQAITLPLSSVAVITVLL